MTTPWKITPIWKGETVAVLASGPSMSQAVADGLRKYRTIAVNHTHRLAPWADMMVALDLNMPLWRDAKDFAGMKVCGVPSDDLDAAYVGPMYERVTLQPGHVVEIMNSGLAAIRIAAAMGAKKIILAGFDPSKAGHFSGRPNSHGRKPHDAFGIGLAAVIAELRGRGVEVEWYAPVEQTDGTSSVLANVPKRTTRRKRAGGINV